jgi:hypothetical protein
MIMENGKRFQIEILGNEDNVKMLSGALHKTLDKSESYKEEKITLSIPEKSDFMYKENPVFHFYASVYDDGLIKELFGSFNNSLKEDSDFQKWNQSGDDSFILFGFFGASKDQFKLYNGLFAFLSACSNAPTEFKEDPATDEWLVTIRCDLNKFFKFCELLK